MLAESPGEQRCAVSSCGTAPACTCQPNQTCRSRAVYGCALLSAWSWHLAAHPVAEQQYLITTGVASPALRGTQFMHGSPGRRALGISCALDISRLQYRTPSFCFSKSADAVHRCNDGTQTVYMLRKKSSSVSQSLSSASSTSPHFQSIEPARADIPSTSPGHSITFNDPRSKCAHRLIACVML